MQRVVWGRTERSSIAELSLLPRPDYAIDTKLWARIILGPKDSPPTFENSFVLPISTIRSASAILAAALDSNFIEGHKKIIYVSEDFADALRVFIWWTCSKEAYCQSILNRCDLLTLTKTWVFGDYYAIPRLQNEAIAVIVCRHNTVTTGTRFLPVKVIDYAYDNTLDDSPLRKVLIDLCVRFTSESIYEAHKHDLPSDFIDDFVAERTRQSDLAKLMAGNRVQRPDTTMATVMYLVPESDTEMKKLPPQGEKFDNPVEWITEEQKIVRYRLIPIPKLGTKRERRIISKARQAKLTDIDVTASQRSWTYH